MVSELEVWISGEREKATVLFDEAEEVRRDSQYTDIDALEQSVYNQAVLDTLANLKNVIRKIQSRERAVERAKTRRKK